MAFVDVCGNLSLYLSEIFNHENGETPLSCDFISASCNGYEHVVYLYR